jgi:recombination DNA repair RAD52 pathway protein
MSEETAQSPMEWYEHEKKRDQERERDRLAKNKALFNELTEPFPPEMERSVVKSGTSLTYIPVSEVITRLNRTFGVCGWSYEIIKCERDAIDPDFVVAHVRLTVNGDFIYPSSTKDGFGGQKIKRKKDGGIVDLGDEFKGAISDALKKAAQHFGVGLYLARDTEAIEIDEAMHSEPQPVDPVVDKYNRFKEIRDMLTKEQLAELREYWNTWSGGRPVPKPSEFTVKELEIMTVEALRLNLGGTVSHDFESDDQ